MKIRTRTSCGDKLSEGACSEREHFFYSGWTSSSASHKLQVGEEVEFQVAVSKRRVWTQSLKQTISEKLAVVLLWPSELGVQNSKWLSLSGVHNKKTDQWVHSSAAIL